MKLLQPEVETMIANMIYEICEVKIDDRDQHLLSKSASISVVDYLYVIDALEKRFDLPVAKIMEKNSYEVFTIRNLAEKICALLRKK